MIRTVGPPAQLFDHGDPTAMPSVWVVPYVELKTYFREYHGGRLNVSRSDILERGGEYLNAWHLIVGTEG